MAEQQPVYGQTLNMEQGSSLRPLIHHIMSGKGATTRHNNAIGHLQDEQLGFLDRKHKAENKMDLANETMRRKMPSGIYDSMPQVSEYWEKRKMDSTPKDM